jgi:hypothetical protein
MSRSPIARLSLAATFALACVASLVGPAAAETVTVSCQGTCGAYYAYDDNLANQGAQCVYNTTANAFDEHLINQIVVRPPEMNGYYTAMTPVSWRYKIQRSRSAGIEQPAHKSIVFTSAWQTSRANTVYTAYLSSGFTSRAHAWTEDYTYADFDQYRVFVQMRWSHNGSVEGRETIRYEWYRQTKGSDAAIEQRWCGGVYPDV